MTKAEAKRLFYWVRVDPGTYRGINNHEAWKHFVSALALSNTVYVWVAESWSNPFKPDAKPRPIYDLKKMRKR